MGVKLIALALGALILAGCTAGHCRRKLDQPGEAKPLETPADPTGGTMNPGAKDTVFVYKYDGSLQCGMGKTIPIEVMAKDLAGIPISTSAKKPDGLMHIQVCGSPTGTANVFEIPAKMLKSAEAKGFKKWAFE